MPSAAEPTAQEVARALQETHDDIKSLTERVAAPALLSALNGAAASLAGRRSDPRLSDNMQVAFIGLPGVGKSTLLNSLLRRYTDETASAPLVAYPTEGIFEDLLAVPSASSSSSGIAPDIDNLFGGGDTQTSSEAFNRAQQNGYIGRFSSHSPLLCNAWPATHVPVHITTGPEWTVTIRYRSAEDVHASISRLRNAVRRLRAEKESPDIGDPSSLQDALASVGLFPSLCLADVDPETIVLPARTRQCLRPGYYVVRRLSIRSRLNALAHFEMVRAQLLRLTVGFWSNSGLIEAVKVTMPSRAMHADGVFFSDFAGFSDTFARRARDFEHTVDADAATIVVLAGGPRESLLERARAPISFIPTWAARRHRSLPLLVVEFHADDSSYSLWRVRLRDGSPSEPMLLWSRLAIDDAAARLRIAVRQYAIDCRRRGLTQVVRDAVNVDIGASLGLAHALSQSIARLDNDARRPVAAWAAQANADEAGMAVATFFEKHYILHVRPRFCDRVAATAMSDALLRAFADIEARYFGTWPPPIGGLLGDSANTQLHVLYGTVVRPMAQALAAASRGAVDFISSWLTSDAVGHVGSLVAPLFEAEQDGCSSALSGAQHALVDTLRRIVEARTRAWADDMAFSVEEIAREAAAPLANAVATSLSASREDAMERMHNAVMHARDTALTQMCAQVDYYVVGAALPLLAEATRLLVAQFRALVFELATANATQEDMFARKLARCVDRKHSRFANLHDALTQQGDPWSSV